MAVFSNDTCVCTALHNQICVVENFTILEALNAISRCNFACRKDLDFIFLTSLCMVVSKI